MVVEQVLVVYLIQGSIKSTTNDLQISGSVVISGSTLNVQTPFSGSTGNISEQHSRISYIKSTKKGWMVVSLTILTTPLMSQRF